MDNHQLINQTSGRTEYYTPKEIVEASRRAMGGIDLDPASSATANEVVKAGTFYGRPGFKIDGAMDGLPVRLYNDLGGLSWSWYGRVFMNHPFGVPEQACRPGCKKKTCQERGWHTGSYIPGNANWINTAVDAYRRHAVDQICILTFASLSEQWFRPLLDYPICFFYGRINYIDPDTGKPAKGVTKGSCLTYLGSNIATFANKFRELGKVLVPFNVMAELARPYWGVK